MNIWKPKRCNCLLWAWLMWWRCGGWLVWRWSYVGWWPHVFWSPDKKRLFEYVPDNYELGRMFPPLLFSGHIQEMLTEVISKSFIVNGKIQSANIDMTQYLNNKL